MQLNTPRWFDVFDRMDDRPSVCWLTVGWLIVCCLIVGRLPVYPTTPRSSTPRRDNACGARTRQLNRRK
jgi:hypothetical protein